MLNKIIKDIKNGKFGIKNKVELLLRLKNLKTTISKDKVKKSSYEARKAISEHYEDLFKTSMKQIRFLNMQVDFLKNVLEEIKTIGEDTLVERVIDNALNRSLIDVDCQTRAIFGKEPKGLK